MKKETLQILRKGFPQHLIRKRKGLGGSYDFVTGISVQDRLDEAFNGDWSWEIDSQFGYKIGKDWIYVVGTLTVYEGAHDLAVRKAGEGAVQIKKRNGQALDLGFDISAASTKALKKAASRFGIAREIEIAEPDDEGSLPAKPQNPTSTGQRRVPTKQSRGNVFPDDDGPPVSEPVSVDTRSDSGEAATPVQVTHIKNKIGSAGVNMIEAIRRGLGREDVPDQPEHLTKDEAKKVLIILNR